MTAPTPAGVGRVAAGFRRPPAAPRDAQYVPLTEAQRLAQDAAKAAEIRRYATHPDVIALRVERVRSQVDRLCWVGIVLGLAFTMTNVQGFATGGARPWSLPWLAAWLLDPTVSLVLVAILRAEQVTARYQVHMGRYVRVAKWLTLGSTYIMNTWASWAAGSVAGVVLHSVPPLVVFAAAEAVTDLRYKLTEAATAAFTEASTDAVPESPGCADRSAVHGRAQRRQRSDREEPRRKLFADYLTEAREAWTSDVVITPAWVRDVTACSRGLSSRLAAVLVSELGGASRGEEADHERRQ